MIAQSKLNKKSLVIIAVENKKEDKVVVYSGKINLSANRLYFNRDNKDLFEITMWQDRIKTVNESVREILLDCEYSLMLLIDDLPQNANPDDYRKTGLKWIK